VTPDYAEGELHRCPHCGALARTEKRADGTFVCAVCGGPRIPGGAGGDDANNALREAKTALGGATRATARGVAWTILAVIATLVVLAATKAALTTSLVLLALAIVPALFAVRARSQASKRKENADAAIEKAWLAAAHEIAAKKRSGITAEELGKALSIDAARADKLLTELAVHDKTRIDVGDDAEVRYSVAPDVLAEAAEESEEFEERLNRR
jgi:hypothetical protein